jgi:hypothetical protein
VQIANFKRWSRFEAERVHHHPDQTKVTTVLGSVLNSNGTITAAIASSSPATISYDPATGNPIVAESLLTIKCYFKFGKQAPIDVAQSQPANQGVQWIEGRVTEMIPVLPRLPVLSKAGLPATIGNIDGTFYPVATLQNAAMEQYEKFQIVGEAIRGWFAPEQINVG